MIASKNVLNGGLSSAECERRWCVENGWIDNAAAEKRRGVRKSKRMSKRSSRQTSWIDAETRDAETQIRPVQQDLDIGFTRPHVQRIQTWRSDVPVGYIDELSPALPPRPGVG